MHNGAATMFCHQCLTQSIKRLQLFAQHPGSNYIAHGSFACHSNSLGGVCLWHFLQVLLTYHVGHKTGKQSSVAFYKGTWHLEKASFLSPENARQILFKSNMGSWGAVHIEDTLCGTWGRDGHVVPTLTWNTIQFSSSRGSTGAEPR